MRVRTGSEQRAGLLLAMAAGALVACLVSVILIVLLPGGSGSIDRRLPESSPLGALISAIVPFVWVGLFAALGAASWLLSRRRRGPGIEGKSVLGVGLLCCVYPIAFSLTDNVMLTIAGNLAVCLAAMTSAALCWRRSRIAAALVIPVALWVGVATVGLVGLLPDRPIQTIASGSSD
jgi:tryptophan-rich sensory protein